MIDTKRLKFTDMIGNDSGSREDSNVTWLWSAFDAAGAVWLGLGGSEADSISCGINDSVGDASEVSVEARIDGLFFIELGECGGEGLGAAVIILGTGRMSCDLTCLD